MKLQLGVAPLVPVLQHGKRMDRVPRTRTMAVALLTEAVDSVGARQPGMLVLVPRMILAPGQAASTPLLPDLGLLPGVPPTRAVEPLPGMLNLLLHLITRVMTLQLPAETILHRLPARMRALQPLVLWLLPRADTLTAPLLPVL